MKIGNLALINTRGKVIIDVEKRVREIYIKGGNEDAYAVYRTLTGASISESWKVVKVWLKKWGIK